VVNPGDDRFVNQVHRADAASALYRLGGDAAMVGIYNVVDDLPLPLSECYRWLAERLQRTIPSPGLAPAAHKRGNTNKRVSNARIRGAGWAPRFPSFMEGMEKSVLPGMDERCF
jgi:hypothetical protein